MAEAVRRAVFDFDGVVCDSTDECMVTSWNAWEQWEGRNAFRRAVEEFSPVERARFRTVRPRVRGAGEYYIVRRALAEGVPISDQRAYDELLARWPEHLDPFKRVFFAMRNRLRGQNLDQWIDLHPVYEDVLQVMKALHRQDRLYVATLKDGESVRLILEKHGLVLRPDRLLDQSQIMSKVEALDRFRHRLGCRPADLVFIDDNVTHLVEPKAAGYPVYLTTWGQGMPEYLEMAAAQRIPLLNDCAALLRDLECAPDAAR